MLSSRNVVFFGFTFACAFLLPTVYWSVTGKLQAISGFARYFSDNGSGAEPTTTKADFVILLSQCRSGSSAVGEIFNRRRNVTYAYEPLYPLRSAEFLPAPESRAVDAAATLEEISRCEFGGLSRRYAAAMNESGNADRKMCLKYDFCGVECEKCSRFLRRDAGICAANGTCPAPIDLSLVRDRCLNSRFRAAKVNYLPRLSLIDSLLRNGGVNIKVVHLVRDPRATVNSVLNGIPSSLNRTSICSRLLANAEYGDRLRNRSGADIYMRVRHEDFCLRPVRVANAIYDFVGAPASVDVVRWLRNSTASTNSRALSADDKWATTRNARHVAEAWRRQLSWREVALVQRTCARAMRKLGYKWFSGERRLRNLSVSSFD